MALMTLTRELAFAAGTDAANRNMRANCRKRWNAEDAGIACDKTNRMLAYIVPLPVAEAMHRDGLIGGDHPVLNGWHDAA